ncbi:hypothetical protein IFR05_015553 [Cadophora sp. M221]|nr:hypothetical protein IFR05_015553 [Cadophora sp. M221]
MKDDLWRRKRLNGYAIATGHEYTWQDVKELIDIADLAIDQQIRKTFRINGWSKLPDKLVGLDRSWVEFEAECQIWKLVAPFSQKYPKPEPQLPNWWANIRTEVKVELQMVMNRYGSIGGCISGGGVNYVTFVPPLRHGEQVCQDGATQVASNRLPPEKRKSTTNTFSRLNTTKPAAAAAAAAAAATTQTSTVEPRSVRVDTKSQYNFYSPLEGATQLCGDSVVNGKEGAAKKAPEHQVTQQATSKEVTVRSEVSSAPINDNSAFRGTTFQKDIAPYICGPKDKEEYIRPVERKFKCRVEGSEEEDSLKLWAEPWQKNGLVDASVIACSVFLKSYEHEIRYNGSQHRKGPRIDIFLELYLRDDFTTVEQRTAADFDNLNRRALGVASNVSPEITNEVPSRAPVASTVADQVTGQIPPLQDFLKVHEGRIKKTYKKELPTENSRFMKRLEATMWAKWCDEYGFDAAPRSSPASQSPAIRQEVEETLQEPSVVSAGKMKAEKTCEWVKIRVVLSD